MPLLAICGIPTPAEALPLPPTLVMGNLERLSPDLNQLDANWKPYGEDMYVTASQTVRYRPIWWPSNMPFWGPTTDAQFLEEFKEGLTLNYRESRRFFERHGVAWIQASRTESSPLVKEWSKVRGCWKLENLRQLGPRPNSYTPEETAILVKARLEWQERVAS